MTGPQIRVPMPVIRAGEIRERERRRDRLLRLSRDPRNPTGSEDEQGPPGESIGAGLRRLVRVGSKYLNPITPYKTVEEVFRARQQGASRTEAIRSQFDDELKLVNQAQLLLDPPGEALGSSLEVLSAKSNRLEDRLTPDLFAKLISAVGLGNTSERQAPPEAHQTLRTIQDIFTGEVSAPEAAGLLRTRFNERDFGSQLLLGVLTDPTIFVGPGALGFGAKKAGSAFGSRLSRQVDEGVRNTFGKSLEDLLPIAGGMSAEDASKLHDVVFGAIKGAVVEERFAQAGGEQVLKEGAAVGRLMDTLKGRGDVMSMQDRAILALSRATGMRIGRITGLTWERLERGLVRGDLIEAAATGRAKEFGDATGAIRIPEANLPAVRQAVDEYKAAVILQDGVTEGSTLAFARGVGKVKNPSIGAREGFTARYKGYVGSEGDLPIFPKFLRHLFAKEAFIRGTPIEAVGKQLAHQDVGITQRFYLRELGINTSATDDELIKALSGLAPDLIDDAVRFAKIAKTTPGGIRKGTALKGGERDITVGEIGRRAEQQIGLDPEDTLALQKLEGETASFYRKGARLFGLKRVVQRLDEMEGLIRQQKAVVKEGLAFKKAADSEFDSLGISLAEKKEIVGRLKAEQKELVAKEKARAAYSRILVQHINREGGDALFNIRQSVKAGSITEDEARMLDSLILRSSELQASKLPQKELTYALVAKAKSKTKRTQMVEARVGDPLFRLPTGEGQVLKSQAAVRKWLDNPVMLTTLDERGMHQNLTVDGIVRVLNKLKNFPMALGDDFAQMLAANPVAAEARIWAVASTMHTDFDLMRRFQFKATKQARKQANIEDATEAGGGLPPREPSEPSVSYEDGGGLGPRFDAGEAIDLVGDVIPQIQTSQKAMAASALVSRIPKVGAKTQSLFESATGLITGLSLFLTEPGRVQAGLLGGFDRATQIGRRVSQAQKIRENVYEFDVRPNFGREKPKQGGSYKRLSRESLPVKKIHPGMENDLRRSHSREEMEAFMRDKDMIYQIGPERWDEFYHMSPEVKDALLAPLHVISKLDDVVEYARITWGFDIRKFLPGEKFIKNYHPRMVGSVANMERLRSSSSTGIRQAQPKFFLERKHDNYWDAIVAGDQYVDDADALGLYAQTIHMMILEHQADKVMRNMAGVIPLHTQNDLQRAARALGGVRDDLVRPRGPEDWKEHGKAIILAERHFPELTERMLKDPTGTADEVAETVRRAIEDFQTTRGLQATQGEILAKEDWRRNFVWQPHEWDQIQKLAFPSTNYLIKAAEGTMKINQFLRFVKTGFDFGAPLIHGFPHFFDNPKRWSDGVLHQFRSFATKEFHREWMNAPEQARIVREMQQRGSTVGTRGEPYEFLSRGIDVKSIGVEVRGPKALGKEAVERFESAFSGFTDFVQVEMYKGMKREGMNNAELDNLVAVINKMTGSYNQTLAGVTPTTRILQSALAFAPLYRKAAYGLIVDAGRGGIRGKLARKALGSMLLGGGFAMWFLGEMTGNDQVLDPSSPLFMKARVGDFYVGIGTAYYSLIRLGANLTEVATGRDLSLKDGFSFEESDKPFERWKNWPDNQLFKWFRAQASPLAANSSDMILGRTFLGETLRDENGPDWDKMGKQFGTELLPFWMDTDMLPTWAGGKELGGKFRASGGELMGLQSFPLSLFQQSFEIKESALLESQDQDIVDWRASQAAAGKEASWRAAPILFKQRLVENNPDIAEIDKRLKEADLDRGDETQKDFILFREGSIKNRATLKQDFLNLAASWNTGLLTDRQFRTKRGEVLTEYGSRVGSLTDRFQAVVVKFEESRLNRSDDAFLGDFIFDRYVIEVINNPNKEDDLGNFQVDMDARNKAAFRESLNNEDIWQYVQSRIRSKQDLPPILQEFEDDKEELKAYWDVHHTQMQPHEARIVEIYLSKGDSVNQSLFENSHPSVKRAVQKWRKLRLKMRGQRPQLDWLLSKWYGIKPSTPFALQQFNQRQVQWGRAVIRG